MSSPPRERVDREPPPLTALPRPRLDFAAPPTPLTSFVGRDDLLPAAQALLHRPDVRLVTLTGPGGVGKTRLALRVAADLERDFADGVAFASLAAIAAGPESTRVVGAAIARALGVREPAATVAEQLRARLHDRQVLLVVDNFEHVLEAAPIVAEILATCPGVKALVTSRGRLRLSGEHDLPVPPLAVPEIAVGAADEAERYPAVALFLARARSIRSDLGLTSENAAAIAEICRRLDGLPLAIELAAGRIGLLPPRALLARLDQRLPLLAGGPRDLPARHQTMRAAIAWDYDLLTPDQQALFRRLAIFAGGFTLEAAEAVASRGVEDAQRAPDSRGETPPVFSSTPRLLDCSTTLDFLAALVDHNLVRQTEQPDGDVRFDMLETIREYGLDRLAASGEEATIRRRHAEWCVALAEAAKPELTGPHQATWLDRLAREHDNLRAALAWTVDSGHEPLLGLRLASALWRFWDVRGYATEGAAWLERALERGAAAPAPLRARALYAAAVVRWADPAVATARYEAALALWTELDQAVEAAQTLNDLGTLAWLAGDFDLAGTRYQAALARLPPGRDDRLVASILHNRGTVALARGDDVTAVGLLEESAALLRPLGDAQALAIVLDNLGTVALRRGEYQRATALHEECLASSRRLGDRLGIGAALANLAAVAFAEGDLARAEALYGEALRIFREIDDRHQAATALRDLAGVVRAQRDDAQAAALLRNALFLFVDVNDRLGIARCLELLAGSLLDQRRPDRAARLIGAAAAYRDALGEPAPADARAEIDDILTGARIALGATRLAAEVAAGRSLTIEAAIATASPPVGGTVSLPAALGPEETDLTRREREILVLLVEGLADRAIAERLSISPRTASKHVRAILAKLDVESRTAAATQAVRRGLV